MIWAQRAVSTSILLAVISTITPAWACSPPEVPAPEVTWQKASIIFRGRITKIEYIEPTGKLKKDAEESPIFEDIPWFPQGLLKVYAAPVAVIKGEPSAYVPLLSHAMGVFACETTFLAGYEYLFVVSPLADVEQIQDYLSDFPSGTAGFIDPTSQIFLDEPSVSKRYKALLRLKEEDNQ